MEELLIATKSDIIHTALTQELSQHKIHICDTGAKALEMLEKLHPTVLIIDLTLPDISGLAVLHISRHKPRVILALTNLISDSVLQASVTVGIQDIILIPCSIRDIVKHIEALIEKAPSLEA